MSYWRNRKGVLQNIESIDRRMEEEFPGESYIYDAKGNAIVFDRIKNHPIGFRPRLAGFHHNKSIGDTNEEA